MMHASTGRMLWGVLHEYATMPDTRGNREAFFATWIDEVKNALECASCFTKLKRFMKLWPVAYGDDFHLWTLCLHDFVNKELGRSLYYPDLTLAPLTQRGILQ